MEKTKGSLTILIVNANFCHNYQHFHCFLIAVDIPGMSREDSLEETEKGYMHDGPDQYMKSPKKVYDFDSDDGPNQYIKSPKKVDDFDSDREYESGLADTLLKSLQSPTSSTSSRASTSVRISSSGVSSSGVYLRLLVNFIIYSYPTVYSVTL